MNRIINKLRRISNDIFFNSSIYGKFVLKNTNHTILMYHGCDSKGDVTYNSRHTSKEAFRKHMIFLKKNSHIISLKDFFEKKFIKGRPNFAITFDDGYLNNYTNAYPIAEELKIPITFFITGLNKTNTNILWADFLNIASVHRNESIIINNEIFKKRGNTFYGMESKLSLYNVIKEVNTSFEYKIMMMQSFGEAEVFKLNPNLFEYWHLMSDLEIEKCSKSTFIEIGAHGYYHNNIGNLSNIDGENELKNVKMYLENILQNEITSIAYPDGSYKRETIDISEKLGYLYQVAAEGLHFKEDETDNRIRDRKGVYTCDSIANQLITNF